MNVCEQCPAYDKCDVTPCGYRGSICAALRFTCGIDSDPKNQNLCVVERGKKVLRGGEVKHKSAEIGTWLVFAFLIAIVFTCVTLSPKGIIGCCIAILSTKGATEFSKDFYRWMVKQ